MALWQFQINIIPYGHKYSKIVSDDLVSWKNIHIPKNIDSLILNVLPLGNSWSENIKIYGNNDSTCIELLYENGHIEEISCRLDLRCLSKAMLTGILNFTKSINGAFLIEDRIVDPEINSVLPYIKNSNAAKFCLNPSEFFEYISEK